MSSPLGIVLILLALLTAFGFATHEEPEPVAPPTPLAEIARRVEALRGVRFERLPNPQTVTADQAREEGLADLDKSYPAAERQADEALYETLGLLPDGTDLKEISASVFGEQVAGYYDPRNGRLRIVEDAAGSGNRVVDEMILAHELTHALEDQVFGFDLETFEASDDPGYAGRALVEGTASALMFSYVERHFKGEEAFGGLLSSAFSVTSTTPLPRFVMEGMTFPYVQGAAFVQELYRSGNDTWRLVDSALKTRPPASTEQVLHPRKWLEVELPVEVTLGDVGEALGPGWTRATDGVFGEWQTEQLIATAGPRGAEAAAGWGGDRYELWRRGDDSVVVLHWVWDSLEDAREFSEAMEPVTKELRATFEWCRRHAVLVVVAGGAPDVEAVLASARGDAPSCERPPR